MYLWTADIHFEINHLIMRCKLSNNIFGDLYHNLHSYLGYVTKSYKYTSCGFIQMLYWRHFARLQWLHCKWHNSDKLFMKNIKIFSLYSVSHSQVPLKYAKHGITKHQALFILKHLWYLRVWRHCWNRFLHVLQIPRHIIADIKCTSSDIMPDALDSAPI